MEQKTETAWKLVSAETLANKDGTESLIVAFQSEGNIFVVTVTGAAPLMLKQAINAWRAGAAHLALENGIDLPDARWAQPGEYEGGGAIN